MSMDYIRRTYGLAVGRGVEVLAMGRIGVITRCTHTVHVRHDDGRVYRYHPNDVMILREGHTP